MNIYVKPIVAFTLLIVASNQALAKKSMNEGERPSRPSFSSLDTNSDSDIDFDEFSSHEIPHGDHQTLFNEIDSDNNGVISAEEFDSHKPAHPRNSKENR